jgi:coenzyme F420 biosynthesis associated uncharacterized protein
VDGVQLVDWSAATATALRLVPPGPRLDLADAVATVDDLRRLAVEADAHVAEHTGLAGAAAAEPATVVDRPGWIRSNVSGFAELVDPLLDTVLADRARSLGPVMTAVGSRATGAEVGVLLAYLSTRVLGQFELFGGGGLTLVAPNIVMAERALDVDPRDFRLWVCLHEVTHRMQFTAVPWLRDHLNEEINRLVEAIDLDPDTVRENLANAVRELGNLVRGNRDSDVPGLFALVQSPAQRAALHRLTAVMSLLEGHAEHVMDAVGPEVVPTVAHIRERFTRRRRGASPSDRLLRRLFGLDVKMRQYAHGRVFVSTVVGAVGMEGFNAVWTSPETLPTRDEIAAPLTWVERVHGIRPAASA